MDDNSLHQNRYQPPRQSGCGVAPGPPPLYDPPEHGLPHWFHAPPPEACFGGSCLPSPFGFDPSIPPPSFVSPPLGQPPRSAPPAAGGTSFLSFPPQFGAASPWFESERGQRPDDGLWDGGPPPAAPRRGLDRGSGTRGRAEEEEAQQKRRDQDWICRFLQGRSRGNQRGPRLRQEHRLPLAELSGVLYGAAALVSRLEQLCLRLQGDDGGWTESYSAALDVRRQLQENMALLRDSEGLARTKVLRVSRKRARLLKARTLRELERKQAEERGCLKEAAIDEWRLRQIQQGEEKKKEQELKLAADAVLCEVRKKQADVKRMQDILRSLEKLRKLRKEAANRKGISTEQQCDELFSSSLEQLRRVMKKRATLYSAEEKALMVMLEGEQEEERRREQEKRMKKERERRLQVKERVDAILFGEKPPADGALQPFRDFYSQADCSFQALIHIRSQWDLFLVASDNPKGSSLPQSWVIPELPSDQNWASALQSTDLD
uniref:Programmed cell death 7 n=1 Tax=Oryzias latipes TaxID=8090 RepID=A0A3P9JZ32_ORYLA